MFDGGVWQPEYTAFTLQVNEGMLCNARCSLRLILIFALSLQLLHDSIVLTCTFTRG